MPDTDPIAALEQIRLTATDPTDDPLVVLERCFDIARAALEHYRFKPEPPDKVGWWWLREPGSEDEIVLVYSPYIAQPERLSFRKNGTYSEWRDLDEVDPDAEWCPVLPPPPREGE